MLGDSAFYRSIIVKFQIIRMARPEEKVRPGYVILKLQTARTTHKPNEPK